MLDKNKYHQHTRSEEVQDIIDRMPSKFSKWVTIIVLCLLLFVLIFGWAIRYPDIVRGSIVINTPIAPIKLVSNSSGQLNLKDFKTMATVRKGDAIGIIENGTSYDIVMHVKKIIEDFNQKDYLKVEVLTTLPDEIALGEITLTYYNFLNSLHQLYNFEADRIYDKQLKSLNNLNSEQLRDIEIGATTVALAEQKSNFVSKAFQRDSTLFSVNASSKAEFERSQQMLLMDKSDLNNAKSRYISLRKEAEQTKAKIIELGVQKQQKKRELELNAIINYNELLDNIKLWEQKYVFIAPFDGKVQFLKFWTDKQFVQAGEHVFTIVPTTVDPYGQVMLPANGAGKVEIGQEVIVKLNDYPYMEFGSIEARVASISLTKSIEIYNANPLETYLVTVDFPNDLRTNYGYPLNVKHESSGVVEIVTKDRRLLERLFDNLKYSLKK